MVKERDGMKEEKKTAEAVNRGSFIFHFIMMCLHMVLDTQ